MPRCSIRQNIPSAIILTSISCQCDQANHRIFNEESVNWMQGIACLKGCGASIEDIREYCDLCRLPESKETLYARYQIILRGNRRISVSKKQK